MHQIHLKSRPLADHPIFQMSDNYKESVRPSHLSMHRPLSALPLWNGTDEVRIHSIHSA